jgi:hypothetical protein
VNTISESGGRVSSFGEMAVDSEAFRRPHYDTLVVCGGTDLIASICTAAFILAEAAC